MGEMADVRVERVETFVEQLAMLQPIYKQGGGDMTRVLLCDGSEWLDPRPVRVVLKEIARHFTVDLTAVRERYGEIIGKRLNVPLPLSPYLVLTPFKMRLPRVQKDGTTGYVANRLIDGVRDSGDGTGACRLVVEGVGEVACLQSAEFAEQQMRHARIVQTFYRERMGAGGRGYASGGVPVTL
ncbi:MAG TPA: hypothetical protein VFV52_13050 [Bacilli bacterium]|nr:hypothetical protein [Bacilli bacterium]